MNNIKKIDEFKKTNKVVLSYINTGKFKLSELEKDLIDNDCVMRVAPAYSVGEYLNDLLEEEILTFKKGLYGLNKDYSPNYDLFSFSEVL